MAAIIGRNHRDLFFIPSILFEENEVNSNVRSVHKNLVCQVCNRVFHKVFAIEKHLRDVHKTVKNQRPPHLVNPMLEPTKSGIDRYKNPMTIEQIRPPSPEFEEKLKEFYLKEIAPLPLDVLLGRATLPSDGSNPFKCFQDELQTRMSPSYMKRHKKEPIKIVSLGKAVEMRTRNSNQQNLMHISAMVNARNKNNNINNRKKIAPGTVVTLDDDGDEIQEVSASDPLTSNSSALPSSSYAARAYSRAAASRSSCRTPVRPSLTKKPTRPMLQRQNNNNRSSKKDVDDDEIVLIDEDEEKQKDSAVDLNEARIDDDDAEISILGDEDDEIRQVVTPVTTPKRSQKALDDSGYGTPASRNSRNSSSTVEIRKRKILQEAEELLVIDDDEDTTIRKAESRSNNNNIVEIESVGKRRRRNDEEESGGVVIDQSYANSFVMNKFLNSDFNAGRHLSKNSSSSRSQGQEEEIEVIDDEVEDNVVWC